MATIRLTLAVAFAALATPAAADNTSVYTRLALDGCRKVAPDPDDPLQSGLWWCNGYAGIKVRVAEGDLRFLVSYGDDAGSEPAASQTLPAFNTIGKTLEWRLDEARQPFATILRFHTEAEGGAKGSTLVVTRLGPPGQICHVGTVDAVANPDANEIARAVADNFAAAFRCGEDEIGNYGVDGDPVERY